MFEKILSLALAVLLIGMITCVPASAQSQAGKNPQEVERVKAKVTKLGTGKQARVEVKLKDNTRLKGYIGEIAEEHFTLVDPKHGTLLRFRTSRSNRLKTLITQGCTRSGLEQLSLAAYYCLWHSHCAARN